MVSYLGCSSDDNNNSSTNEDPNPVYLDANGVTVKAREWAEVGDIGIINSITYTVVDEAMLRDMVGNKDDLTKLATTKVTNMSTIFMDQYDGNFNQPIGNWDVSNVTKMDEMFNGAQIFNQPIGNWDVSNVTDMGWMFIGAASFNQPIGNWDVSSANDMDRIFQDAIKFNQDLSSWDVTNVTECSFFDQNTPEWILPKPNFTNCTP